MKKYIIIFVLSLVIMAPASAYEGSPEPGTLPGSVFYFVDRMWEWLGDQFTWSNAGKAVRSLSHAGERLSEIKALLADDPNRDVTDLLNDYQGELKDATDRIVKEKLKGGKIDEALNNVSDWFQEQKDSITSGVEDVSRQAGDSANKAIENAIEDIDNVEASPNVSPEPSDSLEVDATKDQEELDSLMKQAEDDLNKIQAETE